MPIGFGFGVGDFIATLNLFKDVAVALKDQGGALDDYRRTLAHLESISAILTCLAEVDDPKWRSASLNAIRRSAQRIKDEVNSFLAKINKYKATLGLQGSRASFTSAASKVKWSKYVAGQVTQLYADVNRETNKLQLLLDYHNLSACPDSSEIPADVGRNATTLIHNEQRSTSEQLRLATEERAKFHGSMIVVNHTSHEVTRHEMHKGFSDLTSRVNSFGARLLARNDVKSDIVATKNDINDLKRQMEIQTQLLMKDCTKQNGPSGSSRATRTLTIPTLNISTEEMMSKLSCFADEVRVALQLFFAYLPIGFQNMLVALPHLVVLYQLVLQRLPQAISLVLHDNITFEDALGRTQSLQFQQFRHWEVFEASLRCTFESVPGKQKVLSGQYVLTSLKQAQYITPQTWSTAIQPGIVIRMAMLMQHLKAVKSQCPRCMSFVQSTTESEYYCEDCRVEFALRRGEPSLSVQRSPKISSEKHEKESNHALLGDEVRESALLGDEVGESALRTRQHRLMTREGFVPVRRARLRFECPEDPILLRRAEFEEMKAFKRVHLIEDIAVRSPPPGNAHKTSLHESSDLLDEKYRAMLAEAESYILATRKIPQTR